MNSDLLPNPPYFQKTHNTCAIAAWAAAIAPFVEPSSDSITQSLLKEFRSYGKGLQFEGTNDVEGYYDEWGKKLFEKFAGENPGASMCQWMNYLQQKEIGNLFAKARKCCRITQNLPEAKWSGELKEKEGMACVEYRYTPENQGEEAHYVTAWHDGSEFCIRDSAVQRLIAAKNEKLALAIRIAALDHHIPIKRQSR